MLRAYESSGNFVFPVTIPWAATGQIIRVRPAIGVSHIVCRSIVRNAEDGQGYTGGEAGQLRIHGIDGIADGGVSRAIGYPRI